MLEYRTCLELGNLIKIQFTVLNSMHILDLHTSFYIPVLPLARGHTRLGSVPDIGVSIRDSNVIT